MKPQIQAVGLRPKDSGAVVVAVSNKSDVLGKAQAWKIRNHRLSGRVIHVGGWGVVNVHPMLRSELLHSQLCSDISIPVHAFPQRRLVSS